MLVVMANEGVDLALQVRHRVEGAAADRLLVISANKRST